MDIAFQVEEDHADRVDFEGTPEQFLALAQGQLGLFPLRNVAEHSEHAGSCAVGGCDDIRDARHHANFVVADHYAVLGLEAVQSLAGGSDLCNDAMNVVRMNAVKHILRSDRLC